MIFIFKKRWHPCNLQDLRFGLKKGLIFQQIQKKLLPCFSIKELKNKAKEYGWRVKKQKWIGKDFQLLQEGLQRGFSIEEIHLHLLPHRTIGAITKKLDLKKWKRAKNWTRGELFILDQQTNNGLSLLEIQKNHLSHRTLKELQCRINLPNWNAILYEWHLPFSPDNVQLAFIAGLILADGSFDKRNNGLTIAFKKKHKFLLEFICDVFQFPHSQIKISQNNTSQTGQPHQTAHLRLGCNLGNLFCKHFKLSPQKSFGTMVFPFFLNLQCQKSFLLGLWYGDGSCSYINSSATLSFIASFSFLKDFVKFNHFHNFNLHLHNKSIFKIKTTNFMDAARFYIRGYNAIIFFRFLAEPSVMKQIPFFKEKIKDLLTCQLGKQKINQHWTPNEDYLLKTLLRYRPDYKFTTIASYFHNRSYQSVFYRIKRLNLHIQFPRLLKTT